MSSVADTETIRIVNVPKGQLEYQTSVSSPWLPLQSYNNDRDPPSTVHTIIFREGNISFVQQTCGGAISCSVKLLPMHYGSRIKIGMVESGQSQQFDVIVELTREEPCLTTCLRSANAGTKPTHTPQQCPLARVCESASAMRLYLPRDNFEPKLKKSSKTNEFWSKIVNALRRDLDTVPQPSLGTASKVNFTSGGKRPNNLLASQKQSTPPKKTSTSVQQPATNSGPQRTQGQKAPTQPSKAQTSSPAAKAVQKPPTTPQRQPAPPKPKQTSTLVQPKPPKTNQTSSFVQPTPPKSKQTSMSVQPNPGKPTPPKSEQTSEYVQSQNALIPKTVKQKPLAKPTPINPHPRKIVDYKDLDSVVVVPSGSPDLDYGDPITPSHKGKAKEPEQPKLEASIIQLQKLEEAAELEGDKAMADKARKMIKIFEDDQASPGKETKAQVNNFKRAWTLL